MPGKELPTRSRAPRTSPSLDPRRRNLPAHQTVTSKVSTGASKSLYQARPRTVAFCQTPPSLDPRRRNLPAPGYGKHGVHGAGGRERGRQTERGERETTGSTRPLPSTRPYTRPCWEGGVKSVRSRWRAPRTSPSLDPRRRNLPAHQTVTSKVSTGASKSLYQARPRTVAFYQTFPSLDPRRGNLPAPQAQ